MMGNNDKLIEERTEARAELFRAQERVRELTEQTNILNAQVTVGRKDKENLEAELRKLREENARLREEGVAEGRTCSRFERARQRDPFGKGRK